MLHPSKQLDCFTNYEPLHRCCMAGMPISLEGGYSHNDQQSVSTKILHGMNFMPLLQQSTHGLLMQVQESALPL